MSIAVQQQLTDFNMVPNDRTLQGGLLAAIPRIYIGLELQQQTAHCKMSMKGGKMQRCLPTATH